MSSDVKLDIIGHISGSRPRDWGRQMDGRHHFVQGGICSEMEEKHIFAQKCKENMDMLNVFSCPEQLNR